MSKTLIEARLLYAASANQLARVKPLALRSVLEGLGLAVKAARAEPGEYLILDTSAFRVLIAYCGAPFPLSEFHGVTRPPESDAQRRQILSRLANHRASISVAILESPEADDTPQGLKQRTIWEVLDYLLTVTEAELVLCPGLNRVMTAAEADTWLLRAADAAPEVPADAPPERNLRREIFQREPELSGEVREWLEARKAPEEEEQEDILGESLRKFLDHKYEKDARLLNHTAAGRSALYIMSATIMIFALPIGASALTYNALSGGSLRLTAHAMALTGLASAADALGLTETAVRVASWF